MKETCTMKVVETKVGVAWVCTECEHLFSTKDGFEEQKTCQYCGRAIENFVGYDSEFDYE